MEAQAALIAALSLSALLGLMSLIFLFTILHRFSMGFSICWSIKNSDSVVIKPGIGTFGSVDRYQVLLENETSISIKLVSRGKHEVL